MKLFDKVKVLRDCKYYNDEGIFAGRIGTIISGEIRDNCFLVVFIDERCYDDTYVWTDENIETIKADIILEMEIEDLELVEDAHTPDEVILEDIPKNNPHWWCKVEDGYIMNLLGEKKNKIPYDYKS